MANFFESAFHIIMSLASLGAFVLSIVATFIGIKSLKLTEANLHKTEEVKIQTDPDKITAKKVCNLVMKQIDDIEEKSGVSELFGYANLHNILTSPLFDEFSISKFEEIAHELKDAIKSFNRLTESTAQGMRLKSHVTDKMVVQHIDKIKSVIFKIKTTIK